MNLTHAEMIIAHGPRMIEACEKLICELQKMPSIIQVNDRQEFIASIHPDPIVEIALDEYVEGEKKIDVETLCWEIESRKDEIKAEIYEAERDYSYTEYEWVLESAWKIEQESRKEEFRNCYSISKATLEAMAVIESYDTHKRYDIPRNDIEELKKHVRQLVKRTGRAFSGMINDHSYSVAVRAGIVQMTMEITIPGNRENEHHMAIDGQSVFINLGTPQAILSQKIGKPLREVIDHPLVASDSMIITDGRSYKRHDGEWTVIELEKMEHELIMLQV